jgi:transglutaminase-like putative cysteine protease
MGTVYRVTHRTDYHYAEEVTASYGQLHLLPRELPGQRCLSAKVAVDPAPETLRERLDFFGNRVGFFALHAPHRRLTVTAISVVEVDERVPDTSRFGHRPWELARDAVAAGADGADGEVAQYLLDSPRIELADGYRAYAEASFTPGAGLLDALASLSARIHADFEYRPGSTSVTTPLADVFDRRRGVCQDFAHLGIACVRAIGLPARYVSGYIETNPPPGRPKLAGVDGSHAWLSVFVPGAGWVDIDPTNDQFVGGRYVVTALGRDYDDVPPMNGVIYTDGGTQRLEVSVDVVALEGLSGPGEP